jgi:hypothetical protein
LACPASPQFLLLLIGWHVKVGDMEYSKQPISFDPTKYVLEVGRRGLDLSRELEFIWARGS